MAKVRTSKNELDAEGNIIETKNFELNFEFGTLIVSSVFVNEQGEEQIVPAIVQPWKCLPDGSRAAFINEDDAYSWFEQVKNEFV
jgi:hypothetical protein